MATHNWDRFVIRLPIKETPDRIFKAWTSQEELEKWFLRSAEFKKEDGSSRKRNSEIEEKDTYTWLWHGYGDDSAEKGVILENNGRDRLKFKFGNAGNVTVTVKEAAGEHILELTQDEIPTDEKSQINFHIGCSKGWLFYMTNLKSILEGGIDLRNRNVELTDVINS